MKEGLSDFSLADGEELIDFFSKHDGKRFVTAETFKSTLVEMAHKELIQAPSFVANTWHPILESLFVSPNLLLDLYENLKPSTRRVLKILEVPGL